MRWFTGLIQSGRVKMTFAQSERTLNSIPGRRAARRGKRWVGICSAPSRVAETRCVSRPRGL